MCCITYLRNWDGITFPEYINCPIVTSYGENIKNNVEDIVTNNVTYQNPFLSFEDEDILTKRLVDVFRESNSIPVSEIRNAAHLAWAELE
ncbi:MAG TPA: acyl-CoA dehydratase activase-related protein, partial [Lachnospiraceae bacterium]|nr:acyl-CoA dehydratase activase-related protein [Lachnospiraceae bacterium]